MCLSMNVQIKNVSSEFHRQFLWLIMKRFLPENKKLFLLRPQKKKESWGFVIAAKASNYSWVPLVGGRNFAWLLGLGKNLKKWAMELSCRKFMKSFFSDSSAKFQNLPSLYPTFFSLPNERLFSGSVDWKIRWPFLCKFTFSMCHFLQKKYFFWVSLLSTPGCLLPIFRLPTQGGKRWKNPFFSSLALVSDVHIQKNVGFFRIKIRNSGTAKQSGKQRLSILFY